MNEPQNFSVPAGDDERVTFTIEVGDDIPLAGATVSWEVFEQDHSVVADGATPIITKNSDGLGIEIVESPSSFIVTIARADTLGLLGNYYHEARVVTHLGEYVTTTQGIMTVTEARTV